jgi:hypothetical protein
MSASGTKMYMKHRWNDDVVGETEPTNNPTYIELGLQPGLHAENGMSFTVTCRSFEIFYCIMKITFKIFAPNRLV